MEIKLSVVADFEIVVLRDEVIQPLVKAKAIAG
jgi:hypothetical protein